MTARTHSSRQGQRAAFTLVETLIAMGLLVVVLATCLTAISRARTFSALNSDQLEALHQARQYMEEIRTNSYGCLNLGTTYKAPNYSYVVSVNDCFSNKDVVLTVYYTGALSRVTTVKLATSLCAAVHP